MTGDTLTLYRDRPMLMLGLALLFSLIPVMINQGTGADVMKRIAGPMVGGITSTLITVVLVCPAVFAVWKSRGYRVPEGGIRRSIVER